MVQNNRARKATAHNNTGEQVVQACLNTCSLFGTPAEEQLYNGIRRAAAQLSEGQAQQLESQLLLFQRQGALAVRLCQIQLELASAEPASNGSLTGTGADADLVDGSIDAAAKDHPAIPDGTVAQDSTSVPDDSAEPAATAPAKGAQPGSQAATEQVSIEQLELTEELGLSTDELLQAAFSVADTLNTDETRALAAICGSTLDSVNKRFADWRKSLRTSFQRMESKAARNGYSARTQSTGALTIKESDEGGAGLEADNQGTSVLTRLASQQQRLQSLLDSQGHLSTSVTVPGSLTALMQDDELLFEVKEAILHALANTPAASLQHLISGLIGPLNTWLVAADADKQTSFVRIVLQSLHVLPIPRPLLHHGPLLRTVLGLARSKHAQTATAAQSVISHWQSVHEGLVLPATVHKAANGVVAGAFSPKKGAGSMAKAPAESVKPAEDRLAAMAVPLGRQSTGQQQRGPAVIKPAHYSTQPLSADDIRKQRQKQAAREAYARFSHKHTGSSAKPPAAVGAGEPAAPSATAPVQQAGVARVSTAGAAASTARLTLPGPPVKKLAVAGSGPRPVAVGLRPAPSSTLTGPGAQPLSAEAQQEMLQEQMMRKRRQEVTAAALASCCDDTALIKEMVNCTMDRELKRVQLQVLKAQAKQRQQQQAGKVSDMVPTVGWYEPGWIPASFWDTRSKCPFNSLEASRGRLQPTTTIRPSTMLPVEPPLQEQWPPASTPEPPPIPYLAVDAEEDMKQNEQMWNAGVRSPFLVKPPYRARAGMLQPPPAKPTFKPLAELPPRPVLPRTGTVVAAPPFQPRPGTVMPPPHVQPRSGAVMAPPPAARASPRPTPSMSYSYPRPGPAAAPPPPPPRPAVAASAGPNGYYAALPQPAQAVQSSHTPTVMILPAPHAGAAAPNAYPAGVVLGQSLFGIPAPQVLAQPQVLQAVQGMQVAQPQGMSYNMSAIPLQSLLIPGLHQAAPQPAPPPPLAPSIPGVVDPGLHAALQQLLQAHQMLHRQ